MKGANNIHPIYINTVDMIIPEMEVENYLFFIYFSEQIVLLSLALFFISKWITFFFSFSFLDSEKLASYECGFNPFLDARSPFDTKFYIIAIIFLIFDLEVAFLFPWTIYFEQMDLHAFYSVIAFFTILALGLWYEITKGSLEW